jgi:hypothetical protein
MLGPVGLSHSVGIVISHIFECRRKLRAIALLLYHLQGHPANIETRICQRSSNDAERFGVTGLFQNCHGHAYGIRTNRGVVIGEPGAHCRQSFQTVLEDPTSYERSPEGMQPTNAGIVRSSSNCSTAMMTHSGCSSPSSVYALRVLRFLRGGPV